ncbi:SdrD B-like domain-containing protein [Patescibacteria group bacterium]
MNVGKIVALVLVLGASFLVADIALAETVKSSEMAVCSYDKQSNCMVADYATVNAPTAGTYSVVGRIGRGTHSNNTCQAHEDFTVYINGKYQKTSRDPNPCEPGDHNVYINESFGSVWLNAGSNQIKMQHAYPVSQYGKTGEAESVSVVLTFSKPDPTPGICGSSHRKSFYQKPTNGLCAKGSASSVSGSGPWNWVCRGSNGGSNASCYAIKLKPKTVSVMIDKNDNDNKDDKQTVNKGGTATFKIKVINTGKVTLNNVQVRDIKAPNCNRDFASIASGGARIYTCVRPNVAVAHTNTATVSAKGHNGISQVIVSDSDTSKVNVRSTVSVEIDKNDNDNKDDKQTVNKGGTATFKIKVINTGQVTLSQVRVQDVNAPKCDKSFSSNLVPGGSFQYVCDDVNVISSYTNTAKVTAVGNSGEKDVNVEDADSSKVVIESVPEDPFCGDGNVDAGEQCDDGNNANGDGCSVTCTIEKTTPYCGDGNVDESEKCDDGNNVDGDGCSATCKKEDDKKKEKKKGKCKGSIGNYIWNDEDHDGEQDSNEKGIENVRMKLKWAGEDGKFGNSDDEVYRTDTNHNGHYYFKGLCDGNYKLYVKEEDVDNLKQTYDPDGDKNNKTKVELEGNKDTHSKADFGYAGKVLPVTGSGTWAIVIAVLASLIAIVFVDNPKAKFLAVKRYVFGE